MKFVFLLWLFSLLLPVVQSENSSRPRQSDAQTIAAFAEKGWCFNYGGFWNSENTLAPCRKYCETHKSGTLNDISCLSFGVSFRELKEQGFSYIDDSGHEFVIGECRCDLDGLGKVILDTLVTGLSRLDNILCGVLVESFELILDTGLVALPIGHIKRLETFIRAAKTVAENGLDAGVFFGGWANPICGNGWDKPSEEHVFAELAQASDEYGTSLGCKRMEGCTESQNHRRRGIGSSVGRGLGSLFGKGGRPGPKPGPEKPGKNNNPKKPNDESKSNNKPTSKGEEEPKSTTKEKPTTTEEKPKSTITDKPNSTANGKPTTKTTDAPTTTSKSKSTSTTHRPSATTNHSSSTSKKDSTTTPSTSKPGPTTTDHHGISSTRGSSKPSSTKHNSTQASSTKTQEPSTTSAICKPGKGPGGCSECSDVQAWDPGFVEAENGEEDEHEGIAHLAIRGLGFFDWASPTFEKRARKSSSTAVTPTSTGQQPPPTLTPSEKNGKKVMFCGITAYTAAYPRPLALIKNKNVAKDIIYALKTPRECGDFDFKRRSNSLYTPDYQPLKNDASLRLATEHVLETQLIKIFTKNITGEEGITFPDPYKNKGTSKVNFCTYMGAYWDDKNNNPIPSIGGTSKQATQWIADQFPTTDNYADEFFLLPSVVNGIKARVWSNTTIFLDDMSKLLMDENFPTGSVSKSTTVKAIVKFKDLMSAYKYMAADPVQEVLKKQVGRISRILKSLDTATASLDFISSNQQIKRKYDSRNLQKKWDEWIKKHTQDSIDRIDGYFKKTYRDFTDTRSNLEKDLKAEIKAAEEEEKKNKGKTLTAKQKLEANNKKKKHEAHKEKYQTMIKYLKDLEKTYEDMKKKTVWKNPF
ncbi:hypothetical protein MGYG_07848 [Nannizzia gypsea CBS 118893]|uniref:Uncharacterized protein n=1 Tax=Arthroderma gypseum (strain ATCC MYA-4604 / CBS 118893) TaxID=535722 RepID=E4V4C0_ARTGP|nr:hypothetical protein MGYG_07848 [Nannizzia gypsea CBS 118893]EFR04844.1 hypothetical protein MGYG_07848 [Nannizzia gypsea CBS 118893]